MKLATGTFAVLLVACTVAGTSSAAPAYPERPIRFIVPFSPGGPSDVLARMVGDKLGESLKETVVIDNRGSVGGILGFELAAKAPPDGYTILLAVNSGFTINPHVFKKLPYDPFRDLQPITQLTTGGNVVVLHPSVPARSIKEFIALAKAKPGTINYATTGAGNLLGIALFKSMAGINMVPIAFKGTGQALISLMSGEVQFFFMNPLIAIPQVKSGKLHGIAVTSLTRNPALPDLPTVAEAGVPGFENITWHNIAVPAGTPKPIVKRLNADLARIVHLPDVQERLTAQGLTPVGSAPEQVSAKLKAESKLFAKVVKDIGYQPQ